MTANLILQLTDTVTERQCALRMDSEHASLPLSSILDAYLKNPPVDELVRDNRITEESVDTLLTLQDLVYISSDDGRLHGMYDGVIYKQSGHEIDLDAVPNAVSVQVSGRDVRVIDVTIDRTNVGFDRNWIGFHRRRWDRHADLYERFVEETLQVHSPRETDGVMQFESLDHKLKFLRALARRIWESDFENYSRFRGDMLKYKTGDETVRNIIDGSGGICSEKVQALKFLTDHYGFRSEYVLAGADASGPLPEDRLRELLTTFDFRFSKRYMRYWQHVGLLYDLDGTEVLVDVTNGNVPFLFLQGREAAKMLEDESERALRVRMAVREEEFYYHRVAQDIPEDLYFAMEGWLEDIDLIQVFDNELGLYISREYFVTPVVYRSTGSYERLSQQYLKASSEAGLQCWVSPDWNLESEMGKDLMERDALAATKILECHDHLLSRYDECHGSGHQAGLVLIELRKAGENVQDA